jgi:HK97 family phage prohead protease
MTDAKAFYVRALPSIDVDAEQGTAEALLVPYDRPTPIIEMQPGRGRVAYTEVFRRGSHERALRAGAGRIPFVYNHSESFGDRMGVLTRFWETDEGLYGSLRFDASKLGAVTDAVTSSHSGISIAFVSVVPRAFTERDGSTVERRSVILEHVAAVNTPAYADARVLAVRNIADELSEQEPTAADVAASEEAQNIATLLREAHELISAGERWASFRKEVGQV